jgi:hypothetical protein
MLNPPFRSPRTKVAGMYHLGRMLDKIRLYVSGMLPEEYRPNFGRSFGLDGHLCGFLGIDFDALCGRVGQGGTDQELAAWCFENGLHPNATQIRIWNEFARKFGWNDRASAFLASIRAEDGTTGRADLVTALDTIDFREGRLPEGSGSSPD